MSKAALLVALAGTTALAAATVADEPRSAPLVRTPSGHFAVDVSIQGEGPWPFLVDTGASHTAVAQPLAERFGFVADENRRDPVQTLTSQYVAERFVLTDLVVGPVAVASLHTVVAEIEPDATLAAWGLLGADAFSDRTLEISLAESLLTFDADPPAHRDAIIDPDTELVFATAQVGRFNREVQVLVDTGAPRTLINPVLARELSAWSTALRFTVSGMESLIKEEEARSVLVHTLQVGGMCARRLAVLEADLDIFRALHWTAEPAMVLGLDVLADSVITLDREAGVVELSPGAGARRCNSDRVQRAAALDPSP